MPLDSTRTDLQVRRRRLPATLVVVGAMLIAATGYAQTDPTRTVNPHGSFDQPCEICHTVTSWTPLRAAPDFDHDSQTSWPLVGVHSGVACIDCHLDTVFTEVENTCAGCHADVHRRQFGASCENCHSPQGWEIQALAQNEHQNRFSLQGAHAAESCESCHAGAATGAFTALDTSCVSCHAAEYQTASVDHLALGFPATCENCHSMVRWNSAAFDHAGTAFRLTGAHIAATCDSCHSSGQFSGLDTACVGCHIDDYNGATSPNHLAGNYPTDCSLCHSTSVWEGAQFDHQQTAFPLTGTHVSLTCESCHVGGQFAGLDSECVSCHLDDFNQTTAPDHAAAGFSTSCQICHNTSGWPGAVFDHGTTRFPLLGAHTMATCNSCHVGNQFAGTPTDCYSCHSTEYQTVTDPNHLAANFSTSCESCHGNTTWSGATFSHAFPIYSGAHTQSRWQTCSTCHTNATNYSVFSCLNCHEHRQSEMDGKHSGVGGYAYDSLSCYSCHPNGKN